MQQIFLSTLLNMLDIVFILIAYIVTFKRTKRNITNNVSLFANQSNRNISTFHDILSLITIQILLTDFVFSTNRDWIFEDEHYKTRLKTQLLQEIVQKPTFLDVQIATIRIVASGP